MILRLYFTEDEIFDSDIIKSGFNYTQNYHNNLSPADNFVKCSVPYVEELSDLLKLYINNYTKCEIIKSDNSILFTGFLKNNVSFTKETRNKAIALEIVAGSYLLDKKFTANITESNISLSDAVELILENAGVLSYDTSALPSKTITVLNLTEEDTVKETLKTLLFEFGYTYDFDNENVCTVLPLFNLPDNENGTLQAFIDGNEGNIYGTLNQTATMKAYDGVKANFNKLEYAENQLIFNDSDTHEVSAGGYLYDNEIGCYTEYDSSKGAVKLITSINSWKVTGSNGDITNSNPNRNGLSGTFVNYGNRGLLTVRNTGASVNNVSAVQVYGTGFFVVSAEQVISAEGQNPLETELKFISSNADAENFVEKLTNYYKYSSFKINLNSKDNYTYGSFVTVSAEGMGTITGRIVQKVITLDSPMIKYTIEAVGSFNPVEMENVTNKATNNSPTIDQVENIVEQVAGPIIEQTVEPIVERIVAEVQPAYIGPFATAPDVSSYGAGDFYLNTTDGLTYTVENGAWVVDTGAKLTEHLARCMNDLLDIADDLEEEPTFVKNLVAANVFLNNLFAKKITLQDGGEIVSNNFYDESGAETGNGFKIDSNGNIKANNGYFKGVIATKEEVIQRGSGLNYFLIHNTRDTKKYTKKYTLFANDGEIYLGEFVLTFRQEEEDDGGGILLINNYVVINGTVLDNITLENFEDDHKMNGWYESLFWYGLKITINDLLNGKPLGIQNVIAFIQNLKEE